MSMKITLDLDDISVDGDYNFEPIGKIIRNEITNSVRSMVKKALKDNEKEVSKMVESVKSAAMKEYMDQVKKIKLNGTL